MSRISPAVIAEVQERASYVCELNTDLLPSRESKEGSWPMEFHHRQARAMGGSKGRNQDTAANLLYVCSAHHAYIHAHPEWARLHGYIVSQYSETPS